MRIASQWRASGGKLASSAARWRPAEPSCHTRTPLFAFGTVRYACQLFLGVLCFLCPGVFAALHSIMAVGCKACFKALRFEPRRDGVMQPDQPGSYLRGSVSRAPACSWSCACYGACFSLQLMAAPRLQNVPRLLSSSTASRLMGRCLEEIDISS